MTINTQPVMINNTTPSILSLPGCCTALSGFFTACVVSLVLMLFTPLFQHLPMNVLAAIVISSVSGLFEFEQALHLWKARKLHVA